MRVLFAILIISLSANAFSSGDIERAELKKYLRELNKIDRLFQRAKESVQLGQKQRFDYSVFENDLTVIKRGLSEFIHFSSRAPKNLSENPITINGDYSKDDNLKGKK